MSMTVIASVDAGSPAAKAGVRVGETLTHVDGHPIVDVLDYKFYTYDTRLVLTLLEKNGASRILKVKKRDGEDLGLNFETYLMDNPRSCANHCIFCFVDQLPKGMRESLYFKDDDARLSFLMGNYITLTNLSPRELQRIEDLRISPLNISVHTTNPALRAEMLGHRKGGDCMEQLRRFAKAGVTMNCQIVACPGINDGPELQRTMEDLAGLYPQMNSVSIVPVGLTKHREGLCDLAPYSPELAAEVIDLVEAYGKRCMEQHESSIFWCSDEFYLKAGREIPADAYFEDYTQLENGVGMLRLLLTEFASGLADTEPRATLAPFSIATGCAAAPFLRQIVDSAAAKCHTMEGHVYPIVNRFFGETIDVAGLVTGRDLIDQLRGKPLGQRLLIPVNMLRHGEDVFLDDVTRAQVEEALGLPVVPVNQDGFELCDAIFA
ncbi:MAG: DUF512 domain-containing protein [Pseudoflavonifractor sp.]